MGKGRLLSLRSSPADLPAQQMCDAALHRPSELPERASQRAECVMIEVQPLLSLHQAC